MEVADGMKFWSRIELYSSIRTPGSDQSDGLLYSANLFSWSTLVIYVFFTRIIRVHTYTYALKVIIRWRVEHDLRHWIVNYTMKQN